MAAAAILKIGLMAISAAMAYIWTEFYTGTKKHNLQAILPSKFNSCKIQDGGGRPFEIHFNGHNRTPQAILPSKFNSRKIQDGGGRHFEIHLNGHNSITTTHICTKFGTETKNNAPETELTSYFTSQKIQDGGPTRYKAMRLPDPRKPDTLTLQFVR